MKRKSLVAGLLCSSLVMAAMTCQAATWVKNDVDVPNKNVAANYYDGDSVKPHDKTLSWTEKFELTDFGSKAYTTHLKTFPACKAQIDAKGPAAYHQMDFEMKNGQYRVVAKRAYTKKDELLCTDKDTKEIDSTWHRVVLHSPMSERYYIFVSKYKIGDL